MVFYLLYRQWFSWLFLWTVALLPWLSLGLSYPAMRKVRCSLDCPRVIRQGVPARIALKLSCPYPLPPVRCRIRLVNSLTGERFVGEPGELIPGEHCGRITVTMPEPVVYDHLGLFAKKMPDCGSCTAFILPKPLPGALPPLGQRNDSILRPKPGGGLAEHHELRLYRPGDELRHIHWKASAKTGKLYYREAMEQAKQGHVLTLVLFGDGAELDRRLGRLYWSSKALLEKKYPHQIYCLTGNGAVTYQITGEKSLEEALCDLMSRPCAGADTQPGAEDAFWSQQIGGEALD